MPFNTTDSIENNYYSSPCSSEGSIGWGTIFSFAGNAVQAIVIAGLVFKITTKKVYKSATANSFEEDNTCSIFGCSRHIKYISQSESAGHETRTVEASVGQRGAGTDPASHETIGSGRKSGVAILPRHSVADHLRLVPTPPILDRHDDFDDASSIRSLGDRTHPISPQAEFAGTGLTLKHHHSRGTPLPHDTDASHVVSIAAPHATLHRTSGATPHPDTHRASDATPHATKAKSDTPVASVIMDGVRMMAGAGGAALETVAGNNLALKAVAAGLAALAKTGEHEEAATGVHEGSEENETDGQEVERKKAEDASYSSNPRNAHIVVDIPVSDAREAEPVAHVGLTHAEEVAAEARQAIGVVGVHLDV